jgi:hypothetical protein
MINTKSLKKGNPPQRYVTPNVIGETRTPHKDKKALQLTIDAQTFEDFSRQAGQEFGFSKGSKSKLFLKIWRAFIKNNL